MTSDASDDHLVPEPALRERDAAVRAAAGDAAARHHLVLRDDPAGALLFCYYLVFLDAAGARAAGLGDLDELILFYNRYYWYRRFVKERSAARGYDAGLEQYAVKLLEAAPDDVDWSAIQAIEDRLDAGR